MVTILTKDVGEVKDVSKRESRFQWQLEDGIAGYIKRNLRCGDE
jgi:hypothetical protein